MYVNKALYAVIDRRAHAGGEAEVAQYRASDDSFMFFGTDDDAKRTEVEVLARILAEAAPAYPAVEERDHEFRD